MKRQQNIVLIPYEREAFCFVHANRLFNLSCKWILVDYHSEVDERSLTAFIHHIQRDELLEGVTRETYNVWKSVANTQALW